MPTVTLGNESVIEKLKKDPTGDASPENLITRQRKDLGKQITTCSIPSTSIVKLSDTEQQVLWPFDQQIAAVRVFVEHHFSDKPVWVESDDSGLQTIIAQMYGCREGRPIGWKTD